MLDSLEMKVHAAFSVKVRRKNVGIWWFLLIHGHKANLYMDSQALLNPCMWKGLLVVVNTGHVELKR